MSYSSYSSLSLTLVVAPISAPMLQIVAMPVHEMWSTPGPWYSTMAPVPPFTVRMPATFKITSFGLVQPVSLPDKQRMFLFTSERKVKYLLVLFVSDWVIFLEKSFRSNKNNKSLLELLMVLKTTNTFLF